MRPAVLPNFLLLALLFGALLLPSPSRAQSVKEQIVGVWTMVSADSAGADGSRVQIFGPNPRGVIVFTGGGQFSLIQMRAELPRIAANSRDQGTPEENRAIVQGSIAYFGTHTVSEADKTLMLKLEGSTYANLLAAEQKRIVTSLTADELKFTNPRKPSGMTLEVALKRAR
jgi:Lipocalin-like domain